MIPAMDSGGFQGLLSTSAGSAFYQLPLDSATQTRLVSTGEESQRNPTTFLELYTKLHLKSQR